VLALWNYAAPSGTGASYTMPSGPAGPAKQFAIHFNHVSAKAAVTIYRIDDDHGNVLKAFNAMGRPEGDPTQAQIEQLQAAGAMAPAEHRHLADGSLGLTVPAHGLAVVVIAR
jgi:xylan 1,4-beta-xylosidase